MRMVFALLFFSANGDVIEERTTYYFKKSHCVFMCQELSKPARRYEAVDCICKPEWVDVKNTAIK